MIKERMNVAVMTGIEQISMIEREIPALKANEVLIALEYVGICGSDLHYYEHGAIGDYVVKPPFVLGHEASGRIMEVGEQVHHLKVGDKVAIEPQKTCGKCEYCKSGRYNLCPDVEFFATPPVDGVFQEYVAFPADLCFKLPENVSTLEGALMEPFAVGFHAAMQGEARVGKQVLIMGAGCIGLVSMLACKTMGVSEITMVDMEEKRLSKAKELGATHTILASDPQMQEKLRSIGGQGFDVVIETAGSPQTAKQSIYYSKKGANVVFVGYSRDEEILFPMNAALDKELTLKTVFRYRNHYPTIIQAVATGNIPLKDIVSAVYPFDKIKQALDDSIHLKKDIVKAVIKIK